MRQEVHEIFEEKWSMYEEYKKKEGGGNQDGKGGGKDAAEGALNKSDRNDKEPKITIKDDNVPNETSLGRRLAECLGHEEKSPGHQ